MIHVKEYVDVKDFCTLGSGGHFRYFVEISQPEEIKEVYEFADTKNIPVLPLGGGSNMVFGDGLINVLALRATIGGFEVIREDAESTFLKVGAGVLWDTCVAQACGMNLSGIECMSAIPGTCGATPVQNVGAYGQEIQDTLVSVDVFDTHDLVYKTLSKEDCHFRYRDSIFKSECKGRYYIVAILLRLSKGAPRTPEYPGVKKYFEAQGIGAPTLMDIRQAIISIRSTKLPNPKEIPNVGSFFENPIVDKSVFEKIKENYPNVVCFDMGEGKVKIPAGWLIENVGLKGHNFGKVSVYEKNALVLINNGGATSEDFSVARDMIIQKVSDLFGITLEQEPEIIK